MKTEKPIEVKRFQLRLFQIFKSSCKEIITIKN